MKVCFTIFLINKNTQGIKWEWKKQSINNEAFGCYVLTRFFFRFLFRFYINLFLSGSTQTVLSIFTRTVFFFLIYSLKTKWWREKKRKKNVCPYYFLMLKKTKYFVNLLHEDQKKNFSSLSLSLFAYRNVCPHNEKYWNVFLNAKIN